jgi:hypothetical protein
VWHRSIEHLVTIAIQHTVRPIIEFELQANEGPVMGCSDRVAAPPVM